MATKRKTFRPIFVRQWREFRQLSQERLAERVGKSVGWVSQIENGKVGYTQSALEALADALSTDPASMIMRDPSQPLALWSIWDNASAVEREQIERVAEAIVAKTGTDG